MNKKIEVCDLNVGLLRSCKTVQLHRNVFHGNIPFPLLTVTRGQRFTVFWSICANAITLSHRTVAAAFLLFNAATINHSPSIAYS